MVGSIILVPVHMQTNEYLKPTGLDSTVTAVSVLLIGRDGKSPTKAIGSGVFVSTGLIMTARHVVEGFWDYYGDPKVKAKLRSEGTKKDDFSVYAV
jgi:S1-C subfamily serine protease